MRKPKDLVGQVFGRLTALHRANNIGKKAAWVCLCSCGITTAPITQSNLVTGNTTSCGCYRKDVKNWAEDLTGSLFGYLTVIGFGPVVKSKQTYSCKCVCGAIKNLGKSHLVRNNVRSCGCKRIESITKHGHNKKGKTTQEYIAWGRMLARCNDPSLPEWVNYGARGITVHERWHDFRAFLKDMGHKPGPDYSIERLNNDLGYGPDNCVWATRTEQARNKRNNLILEFDGERRCLAEWCEKLDLDYGTVHARVSVYGWSVERSLTTPTNRGWVPPADRPKTQRRRESRQK